MVYMVPFVAHRRLGAIANPVARRAWRAGEKEPERTYRLDARPIARIRRHAFTLHVPPSKRPWHPAATAVEAAAKLTARLEAEHGVRVGATETAMITWLIDRKAPLLPLKLILDHPEVEDIRTPYRQGRPVEVIDMAIERCFVARFARMWWHHANDLQEAMLDYMALTGLATCPPDTPYQRRYRSRLRAAAEVWPPVFDLEHVITCFEACGLADRRTILRLDRVQTIFLVAFEALVPPPGPGDAPTLDHTYAGPDAFAPCLGGRP